jgi:hopanoid biosynthesis associated protein HpnK
VTADDFGFSHGVNRAILQAYREGIVTHASLMVTGDAADEAVALAKANPGLSVGLHLVVVSGRSALPPSEIPDLVDRNGHFPWGPVRSGLRYQFGGRGVRAQLRREIRAQLERFLQKGLPLTHVDGHLHMHMHPVVLSYLAELADELGIRTVRLPLEELGANLAFDRRAVARKLVWAWIFGRLRRHGERRLRSAGIAFADRVYGLLQTGRVTESYLLDLLPRIRVSTAEIYCHPNSSLPGEPRNGPPEAGRRELEAVTSPRVRRAVEACGFTLAGDPGTASRGLARSVRS